MSRSAFRAARAKPRQMARSARMENGFGWCAVMMRNDEVRLYANIPS